MGAAPKAVIELFFVTYGEGGRLFIVKRAAGLVILAGFFQWYALIDQIDNVDSVQQVINEGGGYSASHRIFVAQAVVLNRVSSQAVA